MQHEHERAELYIQGGKAARILHYVAANPIASSGDLTPMFRFAAILCFALAACTSGATSTGIDPITCPTSSTLTYANFGSAFMTNNCLQCHTSKDSPTLTSQGQIKVNATRILDAAVYTDAMPKDSNMANAERQMLGEWLACGAP